jgi:gliding motility-associated-like protein
MKLLLRNIVATLAFFGSINVGAQCIVDAGPDTVYANCGQSVYLSAVGLSDTPALSTNFDGNQIGAGWSSSATVLFNNPCGPSLDGTPAAWFGNVPFPRTLTTNGFDLSCGGQVCFDLDFAADDVAGSDCEDPDLPDEGVYFQYSTNGGTTWTDIFYFEPVSGYANSYYSWANYCFVLPAAAWTTNTMFQWTQPNASSTVNDHWGIDNVSIIPTNCGYWYDWDNIAGSPDNFDQTVNPNSTTSYIVNYTDGVVGCADTVTVVVTPVNAEATTTNNTLVCTNCADLDVQFTNYNAGSIVDNFDPAVNGTMWEDIQSGATGTNCGSMSGNALYFTGTGNRHAETVDVDATAGCGFMNFSMIIGSSGNSCDNADAGEDVVLEYSTNGGANWTTITTYLQSSWDVNSAWQSFTVPIPPPAQTTATRFRWRQVAFTNTNLHDVWGLDNISFLCTPPAFDVVWTPGATLDDALIQTPQACPLDTTMYVATITDPATGCSATDSVQINVSCNCMFSAVTEIISDCENGNTFSVSGEFIYIENPGSGTIEIEVTNASGTYTQTINGPFVDQQVTPYNISGIISDGSPFTVDIYFSDDLACTYSWNDVSPVLPEVTATSGSGVYCFGDLIGDIIVDVTGNGPFTLDYTLDGTPQTVTSTTSPINLGNVPGDYIITNISDSGCTNVAIGNETIIEQNVPTITSIEDGGVYCANEVVNDVFVVVTGTGPWDVDYTLDGTPMVANGLTDTISLGNAAGVYELVGVTDAGCSNTAAGTQTIVINPMPVIDAGADFISCEDDAITLTATGAQGYVWNNGVTNGVSFVPTITQTYIVTGTDANGCIGTDSIVVTVEPTPSPAFVADVTAGCEPMAVLFTNTTPGSFNDCEWTFGDGNTAIGCADVTNIYDNGGTYDVTLTVTSTNGCSNSVTYDDYIYVEHNPSASFIPSLQTVLSLDTEVSFDNTSVGAVNYEWDFGDGTELVTNENPTHEFPGDQTSGYLVTLYAYSPIGCIDSATTVIQVNEEVIFYIPNSFTPDGDEFNQTFKPVFTAGFDQYDWNMKIFNRWGEIIWESNDHTVGWDGTYNGRMVPSGSYTWTVEFKTIATDERMTETGHVNVLK